MFPPGFEDKVLQYEELQERLSHRQGGDDVGWDDQEEEEEDEGECYYDDDEYEEHRNFYTGDSVHDHEGEELEVGHTPEKEESEVKHEHVEL